MENEPQTLQDRLIKFVRHTGLSMRTFEQKTNMSSGFVRNIIHGIGSEKMRSILSVFPELDLNWLVTGEGQMLRQQPAQIIGDVRDSQVVAPHAMVGSMANNKTDNSYYDAAIVRIVEMNQQTTVAFQKQVGELIELLRSEREERKRLTTANNN